jgi:hypothetical protein
MHQSCKKNKYELEDKRGAIYCRDTNEEDDGNREDDLVRLDAPPPDVGEEVDRRAKSENIH